MSESYQQRPRPSTLEHALGSSSLGEDGCLEVTVVAAPGEQPRVRLTQLAFGVGVGWYAQHSVDLALSEAHNLAALLGRAPQAAPPTDASPALISLAEYRGRRAE